MFPKTKVTRSAEPEVETDDVGHPVRGQATGLRRDGTGLRDGGRAGRRDRVAVGRGRGGRRGDGVSVAVALGATVGDVTAVGAAERWDWRGVVDPHAWRRAPPARRRRSAGGSGGVHGSRDRP